MEAVLTLRESKTTVPVDTCFLPLLIPFEICSGLHKKLHLHLFKFTHTEDKLTGNNFIPERLPCLRDAERNFHTTGLLHVQEIHKNTLCCFRAEINRTRLLTHRTQLCTEHQVKLTHIGPVARSTHRTGNFQIDNNLFYFLEIIRLQSRFETSIDLINFFLIIHHTRIRLTEHLLIKIFKTTLRLLYFFRNLRIYFRDIILDQNIRTVTFFRILIIDQRIIERIYVSRSFPGSWMHKNRRIDTHDIFIQLHHRLPPVVAEILLQLSAHLTIIVHGT